MNWPTHPAADWFSMLSGKELDDLAVDILENGLHEPVWLWRDDGGTDYLLDGRNRVAACEKAGVEVRTLAFIETKNVDATQKYVTVMSRLARRVVDPAPLPAYLVEYRLIHSAGHEIAEFYRTEVFPRDDRRERLSPQEYAEWLVSLRVTHWELECPQRARAMRWLARWEQLQRTMDRSA